MHFTGGNNAVFMISADADSSPTFVVFVILVAAKTASAVEHTDLRGHWYTSVEGLTFSQQLHGAQDSSGDKSPPIALRCHHTNPTILPTSSNGSNCSIAY